MSIVYRQSIPLYFHKAPIRIYNKIINKKGKFWRLWFKVNGKNMLWSHRL